MLKPYPCLLFVLFFLVFEVACKHHDRPSWFQHMAANCHSSHFFSAVGLYDSSLPSPGPDDVKSDVGPVERGQVFDTSNLISASIIDMQHFLCSSLDGFFFVYFDRVRLLHYLLGKMWTRTRVLGWQAVIKALHKLCDCVPVWWVMTPPSTSCSTPHPL